jgi:MOSC domain-containing protein YiiM
MGELQAIWLKRMRGGPMDPVEEVDLKAHQGMLGNANQGGKRQVTLIEQEAWQDTMARLGASLDPSNRRANLMVSGIRLAHTHNRVLRIGNCRIRISGETKPCRLMDETHPGLQDALADNWSGGAFGEVLDDGQIAVGDDVNWIE